MKRILAVLFGLLFLACGNSEPEIIRNESHGSALGTTYNLIYFSVQKRIDLQKEIDSTFAAMNQSLSTYIPDSDISKINDGEEGLVVDMMFQEVFHLSKTIHEATNGYFDPTVGLLVNAWGFGSEKGIQMDSASVDSLMKRVGFDKVKLNGKNVIEKQVPNMYLEFNAIAKGYAVDRLAALMDEKGIQDYLLEVGGELVAKGTNIQKQKEWVVGIDDPQVIDGRELKATITLTDRALASSGNYRHFRIDAETGKKYVHTIDPTSGFTKNGNTLAVTILAENCATADAYATAFMAMDLDDALKLLTSQKDLEAYIIYVDEEGNTQEFMSPGFEEVVLN
ncbi:FAD:protein FMN transferase [Cytophaga sp. FL35]|uniref:FAD:protein FMN transferase n=1 Tax=Cytophaga sp. FL35 TaxID=1904456 RepID=UPI001653DA67|nr:FAD:protein FMN transferase [Cytophaga sp. FL35]MBC6999877.1 FAD:protein FMN transferase [Cytophaga sp. FL35]